MNKIIFNGKKGEYFRIWITNLFLTIVTLGIYSPWAGVINKKYLYQNLDIDGHRFDYVAQPLQILKGRIIALILVFLVIGLSYFNPLMYNISLICLFFLSPWVINRSMSFQLRMTTYRGVSFDFDGEYLKTFLYIVFLPIASILTLFLALPYIQKIGGEYIINKTKFGDRYFKCSLDATEYYKASISIALATLIIAFFTFIFSFMLSPLAMVIIPLGYLVIIAFSAAIWTSIIRNHTFKSSKLEDVASFESEMKISEYAKIQFTNILILVFSLGLAYPIVAIRNTKYLSLTLSAEISDGISSIVDSVSKDKSAVMDEVAGAFDLNI